MAPAEANSEHSAPMALDLSCGCRHVQGRKGITLLPCSEHALDTKHFSIAPPADRVRGQHAHLVLVDELAEFEVAAPAGDRWTHVFATATRVKKGPLKGCLELVMEVVGRRLDGSTGILVSKYRLGQHLYDEQAAMDKVLRGMIHDMDEHPEITPFSEQRPA